MAEMLLKSGAKADYREPTNELYPRTMLCDEPLRLALKNRHYVSGRNSIVFFFVKSDDFLP